MHRSARYPHCAGSLTPQVHVGPYAGRIEHVFGATVPHLAMLSPAPTPQSAVGKQCTSMLPACCNLRRAGTEAAKVYTRAERRRIQHVCRVASPEL